MAKKYDPNEEVDFVIIGSGAGGGVMAKKLSQAGFSCVVLVMGLPAFAAIALAIKIGSKGPVFYRQERIGLDGRPFRMLKFRTMVDGAHSMIDQLAEFNEGAGGQVVFHLHVHVIPRKAGVPMKPPAAEKEKPDTLAEQAKKLAAALATG